MFRFLRRDPVPPAPHVPGPRPAWENGPTQVFPTMAPGRAGNLTPAQRWRAGGWRRNAGSRSGIAHRSGEQAALAVQDGDEGRASR